MTRAAPTLAPSDCRSARRCRLRTPPPTRCAGTRRLATRQDGGHARAHRTFADTQRTVSHDQRNVTDLDARHIGDGVERSRLSIKRNARSRARGLLATLPATFCPQAVPDPPPPAPPQPLQHQRHHPQQPTAPDPFPTLPVISSSCQDNKSTACGVGNSCPTAGCPR